MRITLKNRIISGITVLSLMLSAFAPVYTVHGEGEQEASLYEVMATATDAAEVTLLSSSEESEVEIAPATETDAEIATEEGLEVVEKYIISEREEDSDETLWVKVEQDENVELQPEESMSIYTVSEDKLDDVVIEDIAEEEEPCEIANDTTSLALVKDSGYRHMNIELDSVTLDGMMPKGATAEAVDVTSEFSTENEATETDGIASEMYATETDAYATATDALYESSTTDTIAAFDITIKNGEEEYQPSEDRPIMVSISDPAITSDAGIRIFHIKDNGEREEITDFSLEEGKVSFSAVGFSIYQIVTVGEGGQSYNLFDLLAQKGPDGLDVSFVASARGNAATNPDRGGPFYVSDEEVTFADQNERPGLKSYKRNDTTGRRKICLERSDQGTNKFYISVLSSDGEKQYLQMVTGSYGTNAYRGGLKFADNETSRSLFTLEKHPDADIIRAYATVDGKNFYIIRDGKTSNIADTDSIIAGYANGDDAGTAWFSFKNLLPIKTGLDGKTYGLMKYSSSGVSEAFMADASSNHKTLVDIIVREEGATGSKTYQVSEETDVTMWTFHEVQDGYTLSADINGTTKYLKMDSTGVSFVDEADASTLSVYDGTGNNKGKIQICSGDFYLTYNTNGVFVSGSLSNGNTWLNFIEKTELEDNNIVTYDARKISVSEVENDDKIIIYTRVWNDEERKYEFYAVDHEGKLVRCYERGDDIYWVGNQINTLEWDFTEYYWEDGRPNDYYEFYNSYSGKYLCPKLGGDNLLSDKEVGVNLPGRKDGEYYTDIIAWDEDYFAYAGVKTDDTHSKIISTKRKEAQTFYFATLSPHKDTLTEVETIDNNQYGITMKMIDFSNDRKQQRAVLEEKATEKDVKGILENHLGSSGYPQVTGKTGNEFQNLFSGATRVNHLFIQSTYEASGYFEFDSCQNFATLKKNGQIKDTFTVYKELGTRDGGDIKDTMRHGQFLPYDTIQPGKYSTTFPQNLYNTSASLSNGAQAGLLPETDPRKYERLYTVGSSPDYFYGMELEAGFTQTASGLDAWGHDIIFEFTGDDDFWLYVDDELVIDLGGVHSALAGSVNFSTGVVKVSGFDDRTLRDVFEQNYRARNENATDAEVKDYLSQFFEPGKTTFSEYTSHKMKVFYMERGAGAANLHMRFNLSYVTPGHVTFEKEVTGTEKLDFDQVEYPFQIWYRDTEVAPGETPEDKLLVNTDQNAGVSYQNSTKPVDYVKQGYKPIGSETTYDSVYLIKPGKSVELNLPSNTCQYRIIECGINSELYPEVFFNGQPAEILDNGEETQGGDNTRVTYDSGWIDYKVGKANRAKYTNKVDEEGLRALEITKELVDASGNILYEKDDPTTFGFRLSLSNGVNQELEPANMYKYRMRDDKGNYCRWNRLTKRFESVGVKNFEELPDTSALGGYSKEDCTFETSINGTISEIPAGYTVEIPILPVDMLYKLEERTWEVPLGYKLVEYERIDDVAGQTSTDPITGTILKTEDPKFKVRNMKGWEIEVTKNWSDNAFTDEHDNIYLAAYLGDELLDDQIKVFTKDDKSLRFFFEELAEGHTFDEYTIKEVEVENPVLDTDKRTVKTHGTVTPIEDGNFTHIKAKLKGQTEFGEDPYSYIVNYEQGEAYGATEGVDNVREDTIENIRGRGIVLSLYEWGCQTSDTKIPLPGGEFTLHKGNELLGTYTSDKRGRITILYEFEKNVNYVLEETKTPYGYIGLPEKLTFRINNNNEIEYTYDEKNWVICHQEDTQSTDEQDIVAYVDTYNKPVELKVYKKDKTSGIGLPGAKFALYRSVISNFGEEIKDYKPIPGYEELVTKGGGLLQEVNSTLEPGKYYLTELAAPLGYEFEKDANDKAIDVVFVVTERREIEFLSPLDQGDDGVKFSKEDSGNKVTYKIDIPNEKQGSAKYLTISKTVDGNLGNKAMDFDFTFVVKNINDPNRTYNWTKNGDPQETPLKSGDTFKMRHNDIVLIELDTDIDADITVSEDNQNYVTKFDLSEDDKDAEETNTMDITMDKSYTLEVTNTLDSDIPTGVFLPTRLLLIFGGALLLALINAKRRMRRLNRKEEEE